MGGGAGEGQKKYSRKGKLNEKNPCMPINPKKYSCFGLKKIHTRNLITKKNSCSSKIPLPPPHNFSNGPSLKTCYDNTLLGSLSNNDGDGNKNGKKAIGLDWRNNNFARASRFFVHFLALLLDLDVKMPNFTFYGGHEHKTTTFFFFS